MAIDFEKVKQQQLVTQSRLERGSSSGNRSGYRFWSVKNGRNVIRILPPWTDEGFHQGVFWREVAQHWGVTDNFRGPILCPKKTPGEGGEQGECPICDFVDDLRLRKNDAAAQQLARDLRAKSSYLLNILDVEDPVYTAADVNDWRRRRPEDEVPFAEGDPKVQVYSASITIFNDILSNIQENSLDITDLDNGHDIIVTRHYNAADKLKTRYDVVPKVKSSKADVPPDLLLPALDQVGIKLEFEKLQQLLSEGIGNDYVASLPASNPYGAEDTTQPYVTNERSSSGDSLAASMAAKLAAR